MAFSPALKTITVRSRACTIIYRWWIKCIHIYSILIRKSTSSMSTTRITNISIACQQIKRTSDALVGSGKRPKKIKDRVCRVTAAQKSKSIFTTSQLLTPSRITLTLHTKQALHKVICLMWILIKSSSSLLIIKWCTFRKANSNGTDLMACICLKMLHVTSSRTKGNLKRKRLSNLSLARELLLPPNMTIKLKTLRLQSVHLKMYLVSLLIQNYRIPKKGAKKIALKNKASVMMIYSTSQVSLQGLTQKSTKHL